MENTETAKPAHLDGGGLRKFEQLGGQLEITNSANDSATQARALVSTFDTTALTADTTSSTLEQGSPPPAPTSLRPSYASHLNAKPAAKVKIGTCRECGAQFQAQRATKEFCRKECRQAFNNMQMTRGVLAYQLVMAHRYERRAFESAGGRNLLSRLASIFHEEDNRVRGGRRSWDDLAKVLERNPRLLATVVEVKLAAGRTDRRK
jgi:hypothetical protein